MQGSIKFFKGFLHDRQIRLDSVHNLSSHDDPRTVHNMVICVMPSYVKSLENVQLLNVRRHGRNLQTKIIQKWNIG